MIQQLLPFFKPLYIAIGTLSILVVFRIWVRARYAYKVAAAGGVHAPRLANNPFAAARWIYAIGVAQAQNRLLECFNSAWTWATPESPNTVELNISGGRRTFYTRDPEHIKAILTSKFADYGKGPEFHRVWRPFLGDSIFTTDRQQWQDSRNLIRPMFIKNRVSDLEIFEHRTMVMMGKFPKSGETFDLMNLFYRYTIDVITDFLLGESINSLENPTSKFIAAFHDVQRIQTMLSILSPLDRFVPQRKYKRGIKVLEEFIVPFIDKALALDNYELDKLSKEKSFTFLHALAKYTRDPKVIRDQIIAILLAGRDTTAATLCWTFYQLSNYPATYAKLRREILNVCGPTREPTYDDLKNMKYLNHTLNETLRLYPAVPFNVRSALADTSLPGMPGQPDITVVKGDSVFYSTLAMQRRHDLYPPSSPDFAPPDIFSPERWEKWNPKAWCYIPFNGGPRICVGQNFALTEMAYTIVRIVQRYERIEYRGDWDQQYHKVEIVGTPGHGIPIAMYEAKS
ncbi:cytochrome P450 [Rhizodiscina lignyota]|uniref:Cytochrome P450 n=1 Tax=Rhizodiscina lignyota TaxID=1504668 RepID=A0A9P4M113_9PEZI|nr:cytochrome P450 [Rhizodiscina lignyota]